MKTSPRHRIRELVLQGLYALESHAGEPVTVLSDIIGDEEVTDDNRGFGEQLLSLIWKHRQWADGQIQGLARNWTLERIAAIDRFILRMALVELEYVPSTPIKVVIDEAIELARTFSTPESSAFVNGILDSFAKGSNRVQS
ncbi:MAG: transcription antitermination factor NusB [Candidatus Zixiibacteriota bacterium]